MGDVKKTPVVMDQFDYTPVVVAVVAVVITILLFILYQRKKTVRNGILFTGLCDTGKTLLWARLLHNNFKDTQTSIKENSKLFAVKTGTLQLIDIPGHERLRNKFFDEFKSVARGIIYVVDSLTIQKDVRDVAEFLYNIITDPVIASSSPNLLILCNKQDLPLAKGSNAVKSILEKEMNTLRLTKSSQLDAVDQKSKKSSYLGMEGKDFDFNQLNIKIEFAESNLTSKDDKENLNIQDVEKWLTKLS